MTTRGDAPHMAHGHSALQRVRRGAAATATIAGVLVAGGAATLVTAFAHSFGTPATIPITTGTASGGGYEVGTAVMKDSAQLASNVTSDRTINFFLWAPSSPTCTGTPVFTDSVPAINGPGTVQTLTAYTGTAPQAPQVVGTYQWTANIAAPSGAIEATSNCGDEPVKLVAVPPVSPAISTKQSADGVVGTVLSDTAQVTGGRSLNTGTGTVTFKLFGPTDLTCAAAPVFTSPNIAAASSTGTTANFVSGSFAGATTPGKYSWTADYSGDANNNPVSSPCTAEVTTVSKAAPAISTTPSAGGPTGTPISDSATVTGGVSPTGTVVFNLYGPTDLTCSAAPVFTSTVTLTAATVSSAAFSGTSTEGTYSWTAAYSGDAKNAAATSPCTAETVVITGVQGITINTPGTGSDAAVGKLTIGGFLLLGGLGVAMLGYMIPRRRRAGS